MLVGDSGVGKTCLLVRFKDGAFLAGSFISTVGIDFRVSLNQWNQKQTSKNRHIPHIHAHTNTLPGLVPFVKWGHMYYWDFYLFFQSYSVSLYVPELWVFPVLEVSQDRILIS